MEHIRNFIMSIKALPMGPRTVLAEVCSMCQHGEAKQFYANNANLAKALGLTTQKVSNHLRMLERIGLLLISGTGNGERRVIVPTEILANPNRNDYPTLTETIRVAYQVEKRRAAKKTTNPNRNDYPTLTETIRDKKGINGETLTELVANPNRNSYATLTETSTNPNQNDYHNSIEQYREKNEQLLAEIATLRAAVIDRDKVIEKLEKRIADALTVFAEKKKEIADLKAQLPVEKVAPGSKPNNGLVFSEFWDLYQKKTGPKEKILKKWAALSMATQKHIMAHLKAYRAYKTQSGPQFMPDPQTFLNNKLWEAEDFTAPPALIANNPKNGQPVAPVRAKAITHTNEPSI